MMKAIFIRALLAITILVCFDSCSVTTANTQSSDSSSTKPASISNKVQSRYIGDAPRNRILLLGNEQISESDFGGVERWYAVDNYGDFYVRFQVGYFIDNQIGFVLYEGGSQGVVAKYYRQGLDRRWDWDNYSIVINSDGIGLYYDFSISDDDGKAKPRTMFRMRKF
ncbi:hypothetical protein [Fibrobacter sp. UWB10]|uniref:hypothetical protein n=1 Tax=Fibrobacter sp. UWB10 TaxID=1896201 RepID=UPI002403001D|nr:hypothetical protein [Fibrobacter sp. UWB10]SMP55788.1 hypothetical protein SAMN05720465_2509 [Fibrobacter sp. UWB10]